MGEQIRNDQATQKMAELHLAPPLELLQCANEDGLFGKRREKDLVNSERMCSDGRENTQKIFGCTCTRAESNGTQGIQEMQGQSKETVLEGGESKSKRDRLKKTKRIQEPDGFTQEPIVVNWDVEGQDTAFQISDLGETEWNSGANTETGVKAVESKKESSTESKSKDIDMGASPQILSRMLAHSSASSSSSSLTLSSAESDEVFSEGDDAASKRKTMRKCRSWRTFRTIMHWSMHRQSSWVQLAGHQGNFRLSESGEVLKLFSAVEAACLQALMSDPLRPFVPQYHGHITKGDHTYIRLEDLVSGQKNPITMDCKMGLRTYHEEEIEKARSKPILRMDMYQKMFRVDPSAPSEEEHEQKGVTKWRYLQWKDTTSSTATLGFRIEGLMMENGSLKRDFRKTLTSAQATEAFLSFTKWQPQVLRDYHCRLMALKDALKESPFFRTHEVIGSSLLFVHDHSKKASIWMIDFGKTIPMPCGRELLHNVPWDEGSREDGYLIGLASLTTAVGQALTQAVENQEAEEDLGEDTSKESF